MQLLLWTIHVGLWPTSARLARCTKLVGYLGYFGRTAHVIGTAVRDPKGTIIAHCSGAMPSKRAIKLISPIGRNAPNRNGVRAPGMRM
jgi:hypothetical protein